MKNKKIDGAERKKPFAVRYKNEIRAYTLLAIPLLWWIVFFLVAFVMVIVFSFTDISLSIATLRSFTLDNYRAIFNRNSPLYDGVFWQSIKVSGIWMIFTTIGGNLGGLIIAFLLSRIAKGKRLLLCLLYWPALMSAVVGSKILEYLFESGHTGFVNAFLLSCNLIQEPISWFNNESTALWALMSTSVFLGYSGSLLIYYAAILGVPGEFYEAASLETDSKLKMYIYITLPLIWNAIIINLILSLSNGFKVLGPMQLITEGNPNNSTMSAVLYIYELGIKGNMMGQACANAMVVFVILMVISVVQMKINQKNGERGYE